jgi:hypothetical protein
MRVPIASAFGRCVYHISNVGVVFFSFFNLCLWLNSLSSIGTCRKSGDHP